MRRGVVLFARSKEPHAAALEREFLRRKRPVVRLNPATYPRRRTLSLRIGPETDAETQTGDGLVDHVGAGWFGTGRIVMTSGEIERRAKRFARFAALQGLDSYLRAIDVPWVNDYTVAQRADD